MKREFKGKDQYGKWVLKAKINNGGNGEVWVSKNIENGAIRAIKLLKKNHKTAFQRFTDEINTILNNEDVVGVIKIEDYYLPKDFLNEVPFYVMPLGKPFERSIKAESFTKKIKCILKIAECLAILHKRSIVHRDIKPSNLIILENEPILIDFGLVDFPDKSDITKNKEKIGPYWTMAPEINRQSGEDIDFYKADIYSLAKTLWITLTGQKMGFEGQYNIDTILALKSLYPEKYTTPIDELLRKCTDNDPIQRPNIYEFIAKLKEWINLSKDFHLRNNKQWAEVLNKLFPISVPERAIWKNIDEIISVLQILGATSNLNHLFFPKSGGLDLENARRSTERECIELDFKRIYIVKPKRLIFESFGKDYSWNYFRLETGGLEPSGVYPPKYLKDKIREEVSELRPGEYGDYEIAEDPYYYREMGHDVPSGTRHVTRYFKGDFVIFNKRSIYNLTSSTYDGRHNKMSTDEFRQYIQSSIQSNSVE